MPKSKEQPNDNLLEHFGRVINHYTETELKQPQETEIKIEDSTIFDKLKNYESINEPIIIDNPIDLTQTNQQIIETNDNIDQLNHSNIIDIEHHNTNSMKIMHVDKETIQAINELEFGKNKFSSRFETKGKSSYHPFEVNVSSLTDQQKELIIDNFLHDHEFNFDSEHNGTLKRKHSHRNKEAKINHVLENNQTINSKTKKTESKPKKAKKPLKEKPAKNIIILRVILIIIIISLLATTVIVNFL